MIEDIKERAMQYINELFAKDIEEHFFKTSVINSPCYRIAIVSTPRVASTLLSSRLEFLCGSSTAKEWLHDKYIVAYEDATNSVFSPSSYLNEVQNLYNRETGVFALNLHVNQFLYWYNTHAINVFEYFNFDRVYYIERSNLFEQAYSLAVASKSGLWGSDVEDALRIPAKFKVLVSTLDLDNALGFLNREKKNYTKWIKSKVDQVFTAERIIKGKGKQESEYIIKDLKLNANLSEQNKLPSNHLRRQSSIIEEENKISLQQYFDSISIEQKAV